MQTNFTVVKYVSMKFLKGVAIISGEFQILGTLCVSNEVMRRVMRISASGSVGTGGNLNFQLEYDLFCSATGTVGTGGNSKEYGVFC
jgi:hypothetical protein